MNILWLIIKIILMILLGLCSLILVVLLLVLWSPIRYEAYVACYEELAYDIKVTYLLGIKALFKLEQDKKNHRISAFGKVLYKNEVKETIQETVKVDINERKQEKETKISKYSPIENTEQENTTEKKQITKKASIIKQAQTVEVRKEVNPKIKKELEVETAKVEDTIREETKKTINRMSLSGISQIVFNSITYKAIREILRCIGRIVKSIWPYEWDFEVVIGEEDPADTGETIAKLTMLYPLYYKHGIIRGDYEKACFHGGFLAKGRVYIGHILWHILCCCLKKEIRQLIALIIKLRKEEKNGK